MRKPPAKSYSFDLVVGATKQVKKKINYPNFYDYDVTFSISVESNCLSIREPTVTIPQVPTPPHITGFVSLLRTQNTTIYTHTQRTTRTETITGRAHNQIVTSEFYATPCMQSLSLHLNKPDSL